MPDSRKPKKKSDLVLDTKSLGLIIAVFIEFFFESALVFCRFQSTQTAN
jgi:hypothetical protein